MILRDIEIRLQVDDPTFAGKFDQRSHKVDSGAGDAADPRLEGLAQVWRRRWKGITGAWLAGLAAVALAFGLCTRLPAGSGGPCGNDPRPPTAGTSASATSVRGPAANGPGDGCPRAAASPGNATAPDTAGRTTPHAPTG
jgi:hypothetical protein